ncbi:MAG: glucose-6-phosphate isomerase, partial [Chloroflexi bacterium]|nr:glucose-6-phosphate isomerase [Chloroflexota bacterium]
MLPSILLAHQNLGPYRPAIEAALARLQGEDALRRLWERDHTLWRQDPTEIADRLGWLDVPEAMGDRLPSLRHFAQQVRDDGYEEVVLLGMGGSSLGLEVLQRTFPTAPGFLKLTVLDSTVPAWVRVVTEAVDPARTLFLVSSKSGTTLEPLCLYKHFRRLVEGARGGA